MGNTPSFRSLTVEWELSLGHLLTLLTILVSLLGVTYSWSEDRQLARESQANLVRDAAAESLTKLERMTSLTQFLFIESLPAYVSTSEDIDRAEGKATNRASVRNARDRLWKDLEVAYLNTRERIVDEKVTSGYYKLMKYYPEGHDRYLEVLRRQLDLFEKSYIELASRTEDAVLRISSVGLDYQSAQLGNVLREINGVVRTSYTQESNKIQSSLETELKEIVTSSTADLL